MSQGFDPRHLREAPTHVGAPETSSRREEVPLFLGALQEAETLINTSLLKLIKGKVFAFSSPSLNLSRCLGERKQDSYSWKRVQGREMRRKPLKGRPDRNLSSDL